MPIDPAALFSPAAGIDYRIDLALYDQSNHAPLACRLCHIVGKEVYPHLPEARGHYLDCVYCHRRDRTAERFEVVRTTEDFQRSVHYLRHPQTITCYTCHDPHVFDITYPQKSISEIISDDNAICMNCHDNPAKFGFVTARAFPMIHETHRWLPNLELHWTAVRCVECHTPHTDTFTHEILPKERSEKRCIACHTRDSVLMTTLYKHYAQEERERAGFINAVIFSQAYVVGSTRNKILDRLSLILLLLTLLGLVLHGILRLTLGPSRVMPPNKRYYLYPAWLRIWHWLNAAGFILLNLTGLSMHFSDFEGPSVSFATAVSIHNVTGIVLVVLYVLFLIGTVICVNYRHMVPAWRGLRQRVMRQTRYYLCGVLRRQLPSQEMPAKSVFNPLQQLAYIVVMFVMMPLILISGILLQVPELAPDRILGAGGIWPVAVGHAVLAFWGTLFALVHIYLGSTNRATAPLYSAMITGWHEEYGSAAAGAGVQPKP